MTSCSVPTDYVEYLTHDLVKYHFLAEGGLPSGERLDCSQEIAIPLYNLVQINMKETCGYEVSAGERDVSGLQQLGE
jgi:hypothetical protein